MKTKQCLVIVMTLLCLCVKAQNLRVTGVVRDKSDVIIGASVMVKNSTVGTVTDMDGRYSVEVPANGGFDGNVSDWDDETNVELPVG